MSIQERVIEVIADVTCMSTDIILPHHKLRLDHTDGQQNVDCLDCDEIDLAELVEEIADEFDLDPPDEIENGWKTVQDVIDYVTFNQ